MSTRRQIRRGYSYSQTYRFYEPLAGDPTQPDTDNPIDLTGITIAYVLNRNGAETAITENVTVTPLTGTVEVALSPTQTSGLTKATRVSEYLRFTYANGDVMAKASKFVNIID